MYNKWKDRRNLIMESWQRFKRDRVLLNRERVWTPENLPPKSKNKQKNKAEKPPENILCFRVNLFVRVSGKQHGERHYLIP